MADNPPADPWKLARLVLLLGVMVAFLGAGAVGLVRGVPEEPYGESPHSVADPFWDAARSPNPFEELSGYYDLDGFQRTARIMDMPPLGQALDPFAPPPSP